MYKLLRQNKHKKIRKKIKGDIDRPRLSVYKSSQHIYAQIIDDLKGQTLVALSDITVKTGTKKERAIALGEQLAKKAQTAKIKKIVFDRGGFRFHGRVAALAEGLRKGGLEF